MAARSATSAKPCSEPVVTEAVEDGVWFQIYRPRVAHEDIVDYHPPMSVIVLHGWLGSADDFQPLCSTLCRYGHIVLCPDMPYHSRTFSVSSNAPEKHQQWPKSPASAAQLVLSSANKILQREPSCGQSTESQSAPQNSRVAIVGYSMGGRIALEMLQCDLPSLSVNIVRAVLISSGLPPSDGTHEREAASIRDAELAKTVRSLSCPADMRSWLSDKWYHAPMWGSLSEHESFHKVLQSRIDSMRHATDWCNRGQDGSNDAVLNRTLETGIPITWESARDALADAVLWMGTSKMRALPNDTVPSTFEHACIKDDRVQTRDHSKAQTESRRPPAVLYLCGSRDAKYVKVGTRLQRLAPDSVRLAMLPDAGHNVVFENPGRVNELIRFHLMDTKPFQICGARFLPYELPLRKPMAVGGRDISLRQGILLSVYDDRGHVGVGDLPPLPGLHAATLEECRVQVESWIAKSIGRWVGSEVHGRGLSLALGLPDDEALDPCVACALTAALWTALASVNAMTPADLLAACLNPSRVSSRAPVFVNSVVPRPATSDSSLENARMASVMAGLSQNEPHVAGVRAPVVKLKIGFASDWSEDARTVQALAPAARSCSGMLRLDANRSWSKRTFEHFMAAISNEADVVEYVEEPCSFASLKDWRDTFRDDAFLRASSRDPRLHDRRWIALDETLTGNLDVADEVLQDERTAAIVLKPYVHGALDRLVQLSRRACNASVKVVMSSVFESGVGLAWTAVLASVLGYPANVAHGLGTRHSLTSDVLSGARFGDAAIDLETLLSGHDASGNPALSGASASRFLAAAAALTFEHGTDVGVE